MSKVCQDYLHCNAHPRTVGNGFLLLPHGVKLYLIDCRHNAGRSCNEVAMTGREVGHADAANLNNSAKMIGE